MAKAIRQDQRISVEFRHSSTHHIRCTPHVASRYRCQMEWEIGDTAFFGRGHVAFRSEEEVLYWEFDYRVRRVDTYCQATHKRHCTKYFQRHSPPGGLLAK